MKLDEMKKSRASVDHITTSQMIIKLSYYLENGREKIDLNVIYKILIKLLTSSNVRITIPVSYYYGQCLSQIFLGKKDTNDFWTFLTIITDKIKNSDIPSIIISGVVVKNIGKKFKTQIPQLVSSILSINNSDIDTYVCQCLRRIIHGTESFLDKYFKKIYQYAKKCLDKSNDNIEALKLIPLLLKYGDVKFSEVFKFLCELDNIKDRNSNLAHGRALSKIIYLGSNKELVDCLDHMVTVFSVVKYREVAIYCLYSLFRMLDPVDIISKVGKVVKFMIRVSSLNKDIKVIMNFNYHIIKSIIGICGNSIGRSLSSHMLKTLSKSDLVVSNAILLIIALQTCEVDQKVMHSSLKILYPLIEIEHLDIQRIAIDFFGTHLHLDEKMIQSYFSLFCTFLCKDDISAYAKFGYSSVISLLTTQNNYGKLIPILEKYKCTTIEDPNFYVSFVLLCGLIFNKISCDVVNKITKDLIYIIEDFNGKTVTYNANYSLIALTIFLVLSESTLYIDEKNLLISKVLNLANASLELKFCIMKLVTLTNLKSEIIPNLVHFIIAIVSSSDDYVELNINSMIPNLYHDVDYINRFFLSKAQVRTDGLYTKYLNASGNSVFSYVSKIAIEFFPVAISNMEEEERKVVIKNLFNIAANGAYYPFVLFRSLVQRKSTVPIMPDNAIPKLIKLQHSGIIIKRLIAAIIGRCINHYPVLIPNLFEDMEKMDVHMVLLIISEIAHMLENPFFTKAWTFTIDAAKKNMSYECFLTLYSLLKVYRPESVLFFMRFCIYSAGIESSDKVSIFLKCVELLKNKSFNKEMSLMLTNYYVEKSVCRVLISPFIEEMSICSRYNKYFSVNSPPVLKSLAYKRVDSPEHLAYGFMLVQETGSKKITEDIISAFHRVSDIRIWVDICKNIILNSTVPLYESKGKFKVIPTKAVLLTALKITTLISQKIRDFFPSYIDCVDDIIAISFNASFMDGINMFSSAIKIATNIILKYDDIRNKEGSFIELFAAQLHSMLLHSFKSKEMFSKAIVFCICLLNILKEPVLTETVNQVAAKLQEFDFDIANVKLLRLYLLVSYFSREFFENIKSKIIPVLKDTLTCAYKQEIKLSDFGSELYYMVVILSRTNLLKRSVLLLILSYSDISYYIVAKCLVHFCELNLLHSSDILYITEKLFSSFQERDRSFETKAYIEFNKAENSYYIEPASYGFDISDFMISIIKYEVSKNPVDNNLLGYLLLRCMDISISSNYITLIIDGINDENVLLSAFHNCAEKVGNDTELILFFIIKKLSDDSLIRILGSSEISKLRKPEIIKFILMNIKNVDTNVAVLISDIINKEILPLGITILISLLTTKKTLNIGLYLIKHNYISDLEKNITPSTAPLLLYFIWSLLSAIKTADERLVTMVFNIISKVYDIKDRSTVIPIANKILRQIPSKLVIKAYQKCDKHRIISALTPPKQTSRIELFSLGDHTRRIHSDDELQSLSSDSD